MAVVYLGIGSNVGERKTNCKEAIARLQAAKDIALKAKSQFYLTRPVGGSPQEDYLNGVIRIETQLSPFDLLKLVKTIEKGMGRKIRAACNLPRIIDVDVLLYDCLVVKTDELIIPHPRMHERMFVLKGLNEIAPKAVHPVLGETAAELYRRCQEK